MKKLLNTLFVTTEGAYLARKGDSVLVRVEKTTKLCIPIHTLDSIVCFGPVMCSPPILGLCGEQNVTVSFLTKYGRFLGRLVGPVSGNVLLRREQYRLADNASKSAEIAIAIIGAKIANCRAVLLRAAREQNDDTISRNLGQAASDMARIVKRLRQCNDLEAVRGKEGQAAGIYFGVFDDLITSQKTDFGFTHRTRRPPLDKANALLSFLYSLVAHDAASALESVGLDPAVGFLHRDRPGRPGMALDLMEEFRPVLADRLTLSLINRKQVTGKQFISSESGAVKMNDKARKTLLIAYQKRKQETIKHPFLGEKIPVGLLPFAQALLMARYLRGDIDGYPPFFWK